MLSLPRPHRQGRENDFPEPAFRPKDYPVSEYFGDDQAALELEAEPMAGARSTELIYFLKACYGW